jgi:hypothetical protein
MFSTSLVDIYFKWMLVKESLKECIK